jgi:hypothetical protein
MQLKNFLKNTVKIEISKTSDHYRIGFSVWHPCCFNTDPEPGIRITGLRTDQAPAFLFMGFPDANKKFFCLHLHQSAKKTSYLEVKKL